MPDQILIADDYNDSRELLRMMLEPEGFEIREARDGRECVEAAQRELPSLAIIDLSMPKLDGWGVIRELRADERTRRLPCVLLTAFTSHEDRRRAIDEGFDAYLAKPFRSRDLLELVERLLAERARVSLDGQKVSTTT